MNAIEIKNLSKNFGPKQAVCGLDMTVPMGAIYGFIGENGSGKTTLIRLISGLIFPLEGEFELFGVRNTSKDICKARSKCGAVVEKPSIYMNMSAEDNLKMQATILLKLSSSTRALAMAMLYVNNVVERYLK